MAQQIMFPWGQYKTSELARVLGVSRGRALTALRHLGIVEDRVRGKGIPADLTEQVAAELKRIEDQATQRRDAAKAKRGAKADRKQIRAAA